MILCITEKPNVAKDIARILGATQTRDGYIEGPEYCITWTFGHLCTLKDPADYTSHWRHWSLASLPMIPPRFGIKVKDDPRIQHQMDVITALLKKADKLINCGDPGQEGELIQRWVMQKAGCNIPVERLWTASLTDEALREGFAHLRPNEDLESLYMAGLCRAIGDWVLGINATRLYTLKYGTDRQILSVGRVQTPTLALVVNRQKEIENFVPKITWELRTQYRDTTFTSTLKPFEEEQKGLPVVEKLKEFPLRVVDLTKKKGKEGCPKLFDLTALQVEANKKFGYSVELVLKTAQSLYEKKVTTYPRVDTTYLTEDVHKIAPTILNGLSQYSSFLEPLRGKPLKKSKKIFDNSKVTDHHAIIPTGQPLPQGLTEVEQTVFDMIARRFIAAFYPDCEFEQTVVMAKVDDIQFKATGKVIVNPGWKVLFPTKSKGDQASGETGTLPHFTVGEEGPHTPSLAKKTTQPPSYYTEGDLVKAMETAGATVEDEDLREALKANGIGRPATRDSIIKILYQRGYIIQERKSLRATEAGIALINVIHEELLKSAKLTGIWEAKLREIERGEYSAEKFMEQLKAMIHKVVLSVLKDNSNRTIHAEYQTKQGENDKEGKPAGKTVKKKTTRKAAAKKTKDADKT